MNHKDNVLKTWRLKRGLKPMDVDREMNWHKGKTAGYERAGFLYIPCCDLCKLVSFYGVPLMEFYDLLDSEMERWRRQ